MAKKQIELSTGPEHTPSERWLTATHLVVHWNGGNSGLCYRMTKKELRGALGGEKSVWTTETYICATKSKSFSVNLTKNRLVIGCERFTAADLKIMRRWAGVK